LGFAGAAWSLLSSPPFWSAATAKDLFARIMADERFKPGVLSEVLSGIRTEFKPLIRRNDVARAEGMIRLRLAEEAMQHTSLVERAPLEAIDQKVVLAEAALRSSLELNPGDSFLWLMLYSIDLAHAGFDVRKVGYLEQSYTAGPLEGWVAIRRNKLALAVFPSLSTEMQTKVVSEFCGLIDSNFIESAASNLMGIGWAQRDRLLASLVNVELIPREAFAKRLWQDGLKISVPGVELDERLRR
jgi:hypothetical protein